MSGLALAALPVALVGVLAVAPSLVRTGAGTRGPGGRRSRRGRGARWAGRRDLRPLAVATGSAATAGRIFVGTLPGRTRGVGVAVEPAQSLVVVGPTQSGKTSTLAVPAILSWPGPVLAASVKGDLLAHTLEPRRRRGQVWCIDPTASTGAPGATWSPLTGCSTWPRACATASDLCESAKADATTADGEFWYATAAKLLAPLLLAAALDGRSMTDVVRWVDTQEVAEVAAVLEERAPPQALDAARAGWCRDERTRSSVATTAETVLAPFALAGDAPVAQASPWTPRFEPRHLLGGAHTVFVCAPAHDQRRLRGYFTALIAQVLGHAFTSATRSGRPLEPPLLVVLDEAAHIAPLPELDGLAATCASHGIQLVTVFQDLAQVHGRYGARASTVLNNHRAKLFLPGIADPDTLEYASRLVGDEEVTLPSVTRDPGGRRSTTSSTVARRLLPPEELRCLPWGHAVLVYGTLPPVRVRLRPWWAERGRFGARAPTARWSRPEVRFRRIARR